MKTCSRCDISKDEAEFYKDKSANDGLTASCKECQKAYQNKRYTPRKPRKHECEYCGEEFKSKHNPKYCSDKCGWRAAYERNEQDAYTIVCEGCGEKKEVSTKGARYCSQECFHEYGDLSNRGKHLKDMVYFHECVICQEEFESESPSSKYCSPNCKDPHYKYKYDTKKLSSVYFNNCFVCGELFTARRSNTQCCSQSCSNKMTYYKSNGGIKFRSNNCTECGKSFEVEYVKGDGIAIYCSPHCSQKATKRNRKYRKRTNGYYEDIDRTKVFDYYDWHCQECGIETPKELNGKGLNNSPTLDHIVPLSLGGPHTYSNVQLLCRECNTNKSNNHQGQGVLL